ncbi:MAG: pilus assembly protein PilP [Candidatus Aminicenantes bacterium]|nr:pilus assembly protein PilP [Candidatus Aminicenantes bacterium]
MRRIIRCLAVFAFLALVPGLLAAQSSASGSQEASIEGLDLTKPALYNPAGRRDPFKDLLAGKEFKEKAGSGQVNELAIDDLFLKGIVKARGKLTAILSGPQGFPLFVHTGTRFSDGYILSISETQVVFRKVNERGIPLMRPKDIVKEIAAEER